MNTEKIGMVLVVLKLVSVSLLLFVLLQLMYVGDKIISEKYDVETADAMRAAFYLGGMIGGCVMVVIGLLRACMDGLIDLCVFGLKRIRDHITGESHKQPTHPDWRQT